MDRLTPEFISEFKTHCVKANVMAPNEFFQKGMEIMGQHKLLRRVRNVLPKFFLTHKENRNRLMLRPLNVHNKGYIIHCIGADRKQLTTAVCVELAPSGPTRSK